MKRIFTRSIYFSDESTLEALSTADLIMKREKWSFNEFLSHAIIDYTKRHREGNVSFQLDKFSQPCFKVVSVDNCWKCGSKGVIEYHLEDGSIVMGCGLRKHAPFKVKWLRRI